MLSLKEINLAYPGLSVFHQYSADFQHARTCIIGPNGVGKSSLLAAIAGLIKPTSGTIFWDGTALKQASKNVAIASDSIAFPSFLSARKILQLNQEIWKAQWPTQLIENFCFTPHLDKTIDALSQGNLKKLELINAFMKPSILCLLDEPNIALDNKSLSALWAVIENYQGQIIVASNEPQLFLEQGFTIRPLHED